VKPQSIFTKENPTINSVKLFWNCIGNRQKVDGKLSNNIIIVKLDGKMPINIP
jgi:hypothetical protein